MLEAGAGRMEGGAFNERLAALTAQTIVRAVVGAAVRGGGGGRAY
jgi:hypothetical protein